MSARPFPAIAPRGKDFAVARMSHATAANPRVIVSPGRWTVLAQAEQAAGALDYRLTPTVILVERRAA